MLDTNTFLDEARELLADLEAAMLDLDVNPEGQESIAKAFRAMHTIKGCAGMYGYDELSRFTHDLETTLDCVRGGQLRMNKELISLLLSSLDHIDSLLDFGPQQNGDLKNKSDLLLAGLAPFVGTQPTETQSMPLPVERETQSPPSQGKAIFWIRYQPAPDVQLSGTKPLSLIEELAELGVLHTTFQDIAIPPLLEINPEHVYGWWDCLLESEVTIESIEAVFIFNSGQDRVVITKIGEGELTDSLATDCLLQCCSKKDERTLALELARIFLQKDTETYQPADFKTADSDAATQKHECSQKKSLSVSDNSNNFAATGDSKRGTSSTRVDGARLDSLVDLVGELVITENQLKQLVRKRKERDPLGDGDLELNRLVESLSRTSTELRNTALAMRMMPIGSTFAAFKRVVRDVALELGKDVVFNTEGADTELDKSIIDQLKDPIMHLLRNCVDHGLENPDQRAAAGKQENGLVTLSARQVSGEVQIIISDDGQGLNKEKILAKGIQRGLVQPQQPLSNQAIYNLIMEPGFSTAENVTSVSGRGVGMDVVRKNLEAMHGSIDILSEPGKGTVFTIRLPLTLAIIDGLNVIIGDESYILPLAAIEACEERFIDPEEEKDVDLIKRMNTMVPCISLRRLLGVPGINPGYERIIIAEVDGARFGFAVDFVAGRQQAVIKSMHQVYRNLYWIAGVTINDKGGVSLILDVPQLVRYASKQYETIGVN